MPALKRAPNEKELEKLIRIFLRAETDIINEIGRLRSMGNVDYHAVAALERVQAILKQMETDAWEYVPQMIEKQFYVRVPEARKILEPASKHLSGYANAEALTATQYSVVDRLVTNLMGEIADASAVAMNSLENALLGRQENDIYRRVGLELVAQMQASGAGVRKTAQEIFNALAREGVTAFVDKAGRNWSLHTYCSMVARTTSRQAEVLAVLTADESHDLYKISSHNTTCKICAPLEGRVYSKSGKDPDFPPLAAAFGKVDPNGPDDLGNTWLNIHPNCLVPGGTVLAEGIMAHTSREYDGPVITLETSTGNRITVTPNHPILTTTGFVPAAALQEGQKIVEASGKYRLLFGEAPNDINIPTPVEDIGHSIVQAVGSSTVRVKSSPEQFHGDGTVDGKVKVVFSKGFIECKCNPLGSKPIGEPRLPSGHRRRALLFPKRTPFQILQSTLGSADCPMRRFGFISRIKLISIKGKKFSNIGLRSAASVCNFHITHPAVVKLKKLLEFLCTGFHISRGNVKKLLSGLFPKNPVVDHSSLNGVFGYAEMFRNLSVSEPLSAQRLQSLFCDGALVISELVHVDTSEYHGKVYNLETKYGFYTYNNIVTHNCLHVIMPWTPAGRSEEEIQKTKDFSSFKKNPPSIDPRTQKQIEAYRKKEKAREDWLRDYRQWEKYRIELGGQVPKTFETFQKHKQAGDKKYQQWLDAYKKRFYLQSRLDYNLNGENSFIPTGAQFKAVRTIAGKGSKTAFRHAQDYADLFGGTPQEWSKKVGKIESAKYVFDVHWVEKDGVQYAAKVKNRKEK